MKAGVKLVVSDIFINNLDTVGTPLTLLDPVSGEANLLNNDATVGLGRPLELGFRLFLGLYGEGESLENVVVGGVAAATVCCSSPWSCAHGTDHNILLDFKSDSEDIENDLTITLSMDSLEILLEALLMVSEDNLMQFPIRGRFSSINRLRRDPVSSRAMLISRLWFCGQI